MEPYPSRIIVTARVVVDSGHAETCQVLRHNQLKTGLKVENLRDNE